MPHNVDPSRDLLFGLLALQIWPDRPGPARRRLPGLVPRQGPPNGGHCRRAAIWTTTTGLRSRRWWTSTSGSMAAIRRRAWRRSTPDAPPARAWPGSGMPKLRPRSPSRHGAIRTATILTAPPRTRSAPARPRASGSASFARMPGAAWALCSWRSTASSIARWPSSRSSTRTPTTPSAGSGSWSRPRSPAGSNIPASCPSTGWAPTPAAAPSTPCGSSAGIRSRRPLPTSTRVTARRPTPAAVAGPPQAAAAVHRRV